MAEDLKLSYLSDRPGNDDVMAAIDAASSQGEITYILDTISGKRVAAIVPAEAAEPGLAEPLPGSAHGREERL